MNFYEFFHSITGPQYWATLFLIVIVGWGVENVVEAFTKNRKK
jgi:hypothetical protein